MSSPTHAETLVLPKVGVDLPIKGIACGGSITCSSNSTDVTLTYTATGGGNATIFDDLGDVVITSVSQFSIIFYDGVTWIDQIFKSNSITCSAGQFFSGFSNQTGVYTCSSPSSSGFTEITQLPPGTATILSSNSSSQAEIKSLTQGDGITITNGSNTITVATNFKIDTNLNTTNGNGVTFLTGFDNSTGDFTRKIFQANTTTCSGTDKVSSYNNQTGVVTCSADQTGAGGSGIPLPPKKWGELIPRSASTSLQGLLTGCSILATASYVYDTTDASNAILSTTAVTDGINGGIHCSGTNFNNFRGDQNAYMYSKVEWNKITTNRVYVGFVNSATHLPNNADTILDNLSGVGLCVRTTDTLLQWCRNDGDATTDYVSTGVTETAGTVYRIIVSTVDSGVTWCGSINESQTCWTTEIPATTTQMYADSTGETDGGATAILWTQYIWYVQSDK